MNDVVNGIFEVIGGVLLVINCRSLFRDKTLKGVSVWPAVFFTAWGYWNLYYYPSLGQWVSFWGGIVIVSVNTVWIGMVVWYAVRCRTGERFALKTKRGLQDTVKEYDNRNKEK